MDLLRSLFPIGIILLLISCKEPPPRPVIRLIPLPAQATDQPGTFAITSSTKIEINSENESIQHIAGFLNSHIEKYFGITNPIVASGTAGSHSISLKIDPNLKLGKEDYHLTVLPDGVAIEAATSNGLFYGIQTLIQLMPSTPKKLTEVILPGVEINDTPRFAWRGLQLDVSRHFMPKEFIFKFLDEMAMHKFNTFHWHLADDQGWRIEIKKYPLLTEKGSVRKNTMIGHVNNPSGTDTISYSGFYTQNDIRDIVAYASERFITVIPGIGMPGHALAALAAYPELGCTEAPYEVATKWGIFNEIYCPGKEGTFSFLNDVLTEMAGLFPGKYIHIGGADCPKVRWENCTQCQLRMRNDSLNSTQELEDYFIKRVSKTLVSLGKERVVWDEILKDTLQNNGIVVSWHNEDGAIAAVKRKIQTIVSPAKFCNFDQYQSDPKNEPLSVGGMLTLEQVYKFEPVPTTLSNKESRYIIGAQANIWTPYMKTPVYVEYMTFPRAAALAEVVWSPKSSRNYPWFKKRLLEQIKRYDAEKISYCKAELKIPTN